MLDYIPKRNGVERATIVVPKGCIQRFRHDVNATLLADPIPRWSKFDAHRYVVALYGRHWQYGALLLVNPESPKTNWQSEAEHGAEALRVAIPGGGKKRSGKKTLDG